MAVPGTSANPLVVESSSASKGYRQATSTAAAATLVSLLTGTALPTGATKVLLVPTAAIRLTVDGQTPTATFGVPVAAGQPYKYDGDQLAAMKVYGAATIDCDFYA